jgi:hypothetical protein
MPAFQYQSVLLHQLPDGEGWQIISITHNRQREIVATLAATAGEWLARRWADMAAQNLAGKPAAEID